MSSGEFKIVSHGSTKALLTEHEALLLAHYHDLASNKNTVEGCYPKMTLPDDIKVTRYACAPWSPLCHIDAFIEPDIVCCNSCAKIIDPKQWPIVSCNTCSQMTYCSNDCQLRHRTEGHDAGTCQMLRRINDNCITKGELMTILQEIPKEEEEECKDENSDRCKARSVQSALPSYQEIEQVAKKTRKDEKRFVVQHEIDFEKLIHETIRIECAACGGSEEEEEEKDDGNVNASIRDDVGDRVTLVPLSVILPRFEDLPPFDKKMVFIANSYFNALAYDDNVDLDLFNPANIATSMSTILLTQQRTTEEEKVNAPSSSSSSSSSLVGLPLSLDVGLYPRRRRYYYPRRRPWGPFYYGRPYGWRYGRRYAPRWGYHGYYNDPRLAYYNGAYGGGLTLGIGDTIDGGSEAITPSIFLPVQQRKEFTPLEIESSLLIRGKASEVALNYLKKTISNKRVVSSLLKKSVRPKHSIPSVAFFISVIPVHLKKTKKSDGTEKGTTTATKGASGVLDVENVPTKKTSFAFLVKDAKTTKNVTQMLPVGKYSIERMLGLHALALKIFGFYRFNTAQNALEMPFEGQTTAWSKYDNYALSIAVHGEESASDALTLAKKRVSLSGHFPLDPTYFGRPWQSNVKKNVRLQSAGHSQAQRFILSYLAQNGFAPLSFAIASSVPYKKLSQLPFKQCFVGRVDPNLVTAATTTTTTTTTLLTYEDLFSPSTLSPTTKLGHFKMELLNKHTSGRDYVHSEGADAQVAALNETLMRSIFVFDLDFVPEAKEDMPPSFRDDAYVGITNAQIKEAAEKHGLPIMIVAHEAVDTTNTIATKDDDKKKETVGLIFMFFEWISLTTNNNNNPQGRHVLSQIIYLSHDKNMAYRWLTSK